MIHHLYFTYLTQCFSKQLVHFSIFYDLFSVFSFLLFRFFLFWYPLTVIHASLRQPNICDLWKLVTHHKPTIQVDSIHSIHVSSVLSTINSLSRDVEGCSAYDQCEKLLSAKTGSMRQVTSRCDSLIGTITRVAHGYCMGQQGQFGKCDMTSHNA